MTILLRPCCTDPKTDQPRIAKFSEFRRALRRKNCVHSASVRCEKSRTVAAALGEVGSLFRSEKVRAWRRDHAKFAQKVRERIAKLPEFRHAARRKKCVHSASVRCTTLATSLQLSVKSGVCSDPKKCASGVEITRNPRKNFTKELQNFRNFGAARAQNSFISASMRCANRMTSLKLSAGSIVRLHPKKLARGVEITQIFNKFCAKISRKHCKISGISARLAQKESRVLGQRSLRKLS